jgi:tetratricopeptide (TPR) repeat protein
MELIETNNDELLAVAEILLNKILIDYPDNKIEKSHVFNSLGEIYERKEDYEKGLEYFKKSLSFEKEFPNVITTAYLNFSENVIKTKKIELYDEVEKLLLEEIEKDTLKFPIQNYIIYSILSEVSDFKGNIDKTKYYSALAEESATTEINGLWNPKKRKFGIVKNS